MNATGHTPDLRADDTDAEPTDPLTGWASAEAESLLVSVPKTWVPWDRAVLTALHAGGWPPQIVYSIETARTPHCAP